MAENEVVSRVSAPPRPTITLPPRSSVENIFTGFNASGVSPGPLSLVSSFFSDYSPGIDTRSFSQLLAGAMASPAAIGSSGFQSFVAYDKNEESTKEAVDLGFKQNRPMNLAVARSPLFTIPPGLSPSGFLNSPGQDLFAMSHQQALAQVTAQAALSQSFMHMPSRYQPSSLANPTEPLDNHSSFTTNETTDKQMPLVRHDPRNVNNEPSEVPNSYNKPHTSSLTVDKPVDDGYNWRKYGQKQVKGGEYPRSYYKCTHQHCPVKKKVERSLEGQITEITYKGQHNHELPLPSKRPKDVADVNANVPSQTKPKVSTFGNADSLDKSNVTAIAQPAGMKEQASSQATPAYSGSSDNEERVDKKTRKNTGDDGDEPIPKRRNIEVGASKLAPSHKTVTEQKIVVQTRSEVDLLDDGFRWRKYGQKVVKGNPHPRSYYKCTTAGCNVRKHVERASTDATAVITTYEGKHSHDLPTARTISHNKLNINTQQLKPHKVVPKSHKSLEVIEFGS